MGLGSSREAPYTVVVTGCSSGIGEATALALDAAGFNVLAGVRKQADADRLTGRGSPRLHPIILDVTNDQHVRELPAKVAAVAKGGRVGLVNNAGWSLVGPFETMPMEEFRKMFEVNVLGVVAVTQALLPLIRESKGRIVFISSGAGLLAAPFFSAYSATKFGVEAMADALRREVGPLGVKVSLVEPGWIRSKLVNPEYVDWSWKQAIGRSPPAYHDALRRSLTLCRQSEAGAADPSLIAAAVLDALTLPDPPLRRCVGPGSRPPELLARLPASWADGLLAAGINSFAPAADA